MTLIRSLIETDTKILPEHVVKLLLTIARWVRSGLVGTRPVKSYLPEYEVKLLPVRPAEG